MSARYALVALVASMAMLLSTPRTSVFAQEAPVVVVKAASTEIPSRVELSASVVSPRAARISTDIGGLVQSVKVDLGDRVKKGDPLVQLDATLESLELKQADAAVEQARETLADAEREVRIGQKLAANKNLPQNVLDAREADARIAAAALRQLEAVAAQQKERVKRHTIRAPFDGAVAQRITHEGEWVAPGAAVVELVETARLYVDVPVPQHYYTALGDTPHVTLQFEAVPGQTFEADVIARVPVSDPTARTFTLRLEPWIGDATLTPGMSARATVEYGERVRGIVVPRDAVIRHPDGRTTVWTVKTGAEPTVAEQQVGLGNVFNGKIHIKSGLKDGADVVVRGNESLREGQRVRVTGGS